MDLVDEEVWTTVYRAPTGMFTHTSTWTFIRWRLEGYANAWKRKEGAGPTGLHMDVQGKGREELVSYEWVLPWNECSSFWKILLEHTPICPFHVKVNPRFSLPVSFFFFRSTLMHMHACYTLLSPRLYITTVYAFTEGKAHLASNKLLLCMLRIPSWELPPKETFFYQFLSKVRSR